MESSIPDTFVANMCPDYRGVINSGMNLYYKAQFGALVIQGNPHFRVFSIEGFHCIIILMLYKITNEYRNICVSCQMNKNTCTIHTEIYCLGYIIDYIDICTRLYTIHYNL